MRVGRNTGIASLARGLLVELPWTHILTDHCLLAMARRGINAKEIAAVLRDPKRTETLRPGRVVCQAELFLSQAGRVYLVRVVVDIDRDPAEVVTVYRTGRVGRYRRERS